MTKPKAIQWLEEQTGEPIDYTAAVEQRRATADLDGRALADRLAADVAEVRRRLAS